MVHPPSCQRWHEQNPASCEQETCRLGHCLLAMQANKTRQIEAQASGLLTAIDCFKDGIMLVDTSTPLWNIIFINDTWTRVTGNFFWGPDGLDEDGCFCSGPLLVKTPVDAPVKQFGRVFNFQPQSR